LIVARPKEVYGRGESVCRNDRVEEPEAGSWNSGIGDATARRRSSSARIRSRSTVGVFRRDGGCSGAAGVIGDGGAAVARGRFTGLPTKISASLGL
jgi:hypothetical protein